MTRRPFPVTDGDQDAPDGAVVRIESGWYRRSGSTWFPCAAPESEIENTVVPNVGPAPGRSTPPRGDRSGCG